MSLAAGYFAPRPHCVQHKFQDREGHSICCSDDGDVAVGRQHPADAMRLVAFLRPHDLWPDASDLGCYGRYELHAQMCSHGQLCLCVI